MIPYDADALAAEIVQKEKSIELFENKIKELRDEITRSRIWIAELENDKKAS